MSTNLNFDFDHFLRNFNCSNYNSKVKEFCPTLLLIPFINEIETDEKKYIQTCSTGDKRKREDD